jgi:bifunctional DNA-binding transcriptional regulator/antitoxin component of YhaV-PrlF toxin-antitoxin module
VLPGPIRRQLGLLPGDELEATIEGARIVLTAVQVRTAKPALRRDAATGLPVLTAGRKAHRLTSERVREILAAFP